MTININIISGFLGVGKTTLLRKIIPNIKGKVVLIENEFGDIGIDGDLIDSELPIREIYSGCICCTLVHDFKKAIEELAIKYKPDHILIEPSGVGSLSDITKICKKIRETSNIDIKINNLITIVDIKGFNNYIEDFGGFYLDQIENANIIFLSHLGGVGNRELEEVVSKIRLNNKEAFILKEDWYSYNGEKIIEMLNDIKKSPVQFKGKYSLETANKVFSSFSIDNPRTFKEKEIKDTLNDLIDLDYGLVLRAKGILNLDNNKVIHFDFTPQHYDWEYIEKTSETKVIVIGSDLKNEKISRCFQ
ncbi:GTP-binding protein [Dethiothermospora halolimnae]|uniref:GTP-binding protein n=1 Tax=Dethiothermospora halolimnae TaxID=3114390 RepID=UPI003CCBBA1E